MYKPPDWLTPPQGMVKIILVILAFMVALPFHFIKRQIAK
jgi:hypothetical protein